MGSWITSFFDDHNEIARDVRNDYLDALRFGRTGRQATRDVLEGFQEAIIDDDAAESIMWMALTVTQWEYGRLEPRVKARALKAINRGGDVATCPPQEQQRRSKVLERVKARLESPPPAEKRVRQVKLAKPLEKIERLLEPGQVVAFRRDSGRFVLLLTEGVVKDEYLSDSRFCPGGRSGQREHHVARSRVEQLKGRHVLAGRRDNALSVGREDSAVYIAGKGSNVEEHLICSGTLES